MKENELNINKDLSQNNFNLEEEILSIKNEILSIKSTLELLKFKIELLEVLISKQEQDKYHIYPEPWCPSHDVICSIIPDWSDKARTITNEPLIKNGNK